MPEVSAYEMKRLTTIRENHFLLKELCGPGESVYEFQNSKALLDAAIALDTGRLPTPTPPGSSTSESSDGDMKETNVTSEKHKKKKDTGSSNVQASNANAVKVPELKDFTGESERVLRTRKKIEDLPQGRIDISEEDSSTAADSDSDFVEGSSTVHSSCESESEELDEEDEAEYEDTDSGTEESDKQDNQDTIPSKATVDIGVVAVEDDSNKIGIPIQKNPSLSAPSREEGRGVPEKRRKVTFRMDASEDEERDNQGFERWQTGKKSKRKPSSPKRKSSKKYGTDSQFPKGNSGDQNYRPQKPLRRSEPTEKAVFEKKKSGSGLSKKNAEEGTVNISEKEYRMLLNLKEKSAAAVMGFSKKDLKGTSLNRDEVRFSKKLLSLAGDVEDLQKRIAGTSNVFGEDVEEDVGELNAPNGKKQGELTSPVEELAHEQDYWSKEDRKNEDSIEAHVNHASDSDLQKPPKVRFGVVRTGSAVFKRSREDGAKLSTARNEGLHGASQGESVGVGRGSGSQPVAVGSERHEMATGDGFDNEMRKKKRRLHDMRPQRQELKAIEKNNSSLKKKMHEDGLQLLAVRGSTVVSTVSDDDNDFEAEPAADFGSKKFLQQPLLTESEARTDRKRRKATRDTAMRKRESAGNKPFYIMVNAMGTPYGDGLSAWRSEVNKLSRGLDPSVRDVRQQPHRQIEILKKRLAEKFDYSDEISDKYLLPLIGQRVSARRNELMNLIRAGKKCPSGFDEDIWDRLESISKSPNFKKKSAAMQYANACRHTLGRTGPGGEIRVRDSLKQTLRRSPDPDEVQAEMTRDKGYGGRKRKMKKMAVREKKSFEDADGDDEGLGNEMKEPPNGVAGDVAVAEQVSFQNSHAEGGKDTSVEQVDLIRKLLLQIEGLKATMEGSLLQSSIQIPQAPLQSVVVSLAPSAYAEVTEQVDAAAETPQSLLENTSMFSITKRQT